MPSLSKRARALGRIHLFCKLCIPCEVKGACIKDRNISGHALYWLSSKKLLRNQACWQESICLSWFLLIQSTLFLQENLSTTLDQLMLGWSCLLSLVETRWGVSAPDNPLRSARSEGALCWSCYMRGFKPPLSSHTLLSHLDPWVIFNSRRSSLGVLFSCLSDVIHLTSTYIEQAKSIWQ